MKLKLKNDAYPVSFSIISLFLSTILSTQLVLLGIKIFNQKLMENLIKSSKIIEYFYKSNFGLYLCITLMSILLIIKLIGCFVGLIITDKFNGTKLEKFSIISQLITGVSISTISIVSILLIVNNKIPEKSINILEKIFFIGFAGSMILSIFCGLIMLIYGILINKSMNYEDSKKHNSNLNACILVANMVIGGFSFSANGKLPCQGVKDEDNLVDRGIKKWDEDSKKSNLIDENHVELTFLNLFTLEFFGKSNANPTL
jgi:hypothetical protein